MQSEGNEFLPVPVAPVIRTVVKCGAIRRIFAHPFSSISGLRQCLQIYMRLRVPDRGAMFCFVLRHLPSERRFESEAY